MGFWPCHWLARGPHAGPKKATRSELGSENALEMPRCTVCCEETPPRSAAEFEATRQTRGAVRTPPCRLPRGRQLHSREAAPPSGCTPLPRRTPRTPRGRPPPLMWDPQAGGDTAGRGCAAVTPGRKQPPVSLSRLRSPPPIDVQRGMACDQQAQLWVASSGGLSMCSACHLSPPTSPAQRAGQGDRGQSLRQVGPQRKDGPAVGRVFCPTTGWRSPAKPSELETPRVPETPAGGPRAQTTPAATRRRPPSSPRLQVGGPRVRRV